MRAHVHILRKSVPLRPSDCSHGKAMRQSASTSHCFPPPMYTISNQAARCASVTSFAQAKLAAVRQIRLFRRLSFCAPEPRDNALCTVCCMETLYVSLRDATNKMFLNPSLRPYAFVHPPQTSSLCTHCFIMVGGHSGI